MIWLVGLAGLAVVAACLRWIGNDQRRREEADEQALCELAHRHSLKVVVHHRRNGSWAVHSGPVWALEFSRSEAIRAALHKLEDRYNPRVETLGPQDDLENG